MKKLGNWVLIANECGVSAWAFYSHVALIEACYLGACLIHPLSCFVPTDAARYDACNKIETDGEVASLSNISMQFIAPVGNIRRLWRR